MKIILFLSVILFSLLGIEDLSAQTGIIASDGVYMPRMTTAMRNAIINPGSGQMIYNTDDDCFNVFQKGNWQKLCSNDATVLGKWTKKADFGGGLRDRATGFSIGNKGYIGTGNNVGAIKSDFWEYDPATNVWTQKADFGGGKRFYAVGFSIGSKGYLGIGSLANNNAMLPNDFWEYDPASNVWTQKANFGGTARISAVGFSIGSKGYIGTGTDGNTIFKNDFWEYDPANDTWTQKANFGGVTRHRAVGFSIGSKGYIGTGRHDSAAKSDFWEYDPTNNTWIQKADYGGGARDRAVGFSIGRKGYLGTGGNDDFWEYNPDTDIWTQKLNVGGGSRIGAVGFSVGNRGYIGTASGIDFWEYNINGTNITYQGNVFNGVNQLLKLDDSGNLPLIGNLTIGGNIIDEGFTAPTLLNNWINYDAAGSYEGAGFYKDKKSVVRLKGFIKNGTTTPSTVLFILPEGYRPTEIMIFAVINSNLFGRVDVYPNGEVRTLAGGNVYLSLDGLTFKAN